MVCLDESQLETVHTTGRLHCTAQNRGGMGAAVQVRECVGQALARQLQSTAWQGRAGVCTLHASTSRSTIDMKSFLNSLRPSAACSRPSLLKRVEPHAWVRGATPEAAATCSSDGT